VRDANRWSIRIATRFIVLRDGGPSFFAGCDAPGAILKKVQRKMRANTTAHAMRDAPCAPERFRARFLSAGARCGARSCK